MADIFIALDQLFKGETPAEYPSPWILQRFLAHDPDFARVANEVQNAIRGPEDTFVVWQSMVRPMGLTRAPKLGYVGPKKEAKAEGLVQGLMDRRRVSRPVAEQMAELLILCGVEKPAAAELGIEIK